jgi:signal peptidase I
MNSKPRRPWLAAVFTILEIGLGHIYCGNPKKGLVLFCIDLCLFLLTVVSMLLIARNALHMIIAAGVVLAFWFYCVVDAALIARRKKENYQLAKYNRWYVYLGFILAAWLVGNALSSFVVTPYLVQPYMLPTGAMEPTLLVGDHILVDKHIYGGHKPKRGDVVIFEYSPEPEVDYVKRLIGEPGDTVEMIGRTVFVNGKPLKENYAQYLDPKSIRDHYGPFSVPPDQYFVLGDNRDNSQDSRFWGFIPGENMLGKAMIIYWSFDIGRDSYLPKTSSERLRQSVDNVRNFFSKTRWRRTFQAIH